MRKIKIVGILIFIILLALITLFSYISKQNHINKDRLNLINTQKSCTQEISKHTLYIYKHKNSSSIELDNSLKICLEKFDKNDKSWNKFYLLIQDFKKQNMVVTAYSNIILEKIIKNIYITNIEMLTAFNKLIETNNKKVSQSINGYKNIQYTLFFIFLILLIYLFSQLQAILTFIQKFTQTSKKIIDSSSVKDLKLLDTKANNIEIQEASDNFNAIVNKIDNSIEYARDSIQHTCNSIETIDANIENLFEFLSTMDDDIPNKELSKKEDAIIQALEELGQSTQHLKKLQLTLETLTVKK